MVIINLEVYKGTALFLPVDLSFKVNSLVEIISIRKTSSSVSVLGDPNKCSYPWEESRRDIFVREASWCIMS